MNIYSRLLASYQRARYCNPRVNPVLQPIPAFPGPVMASPPTFTMNIAAAPTGTLPKVINIMGAGATSPTVSPMFSVTNADYQQNYFNTYLRLGAIWSVNNSPGDLGNDPTTGLGITSLGGRLTFKVATQKFGLKLGQQTFQMLVNGVYVNAAGITQASNNYCTVDFGSGGPVPREITLEYSYPACAFGAIYLLATDTIYPPSQPDIVAYSIGDSYQSTGATIMANCLQFVMADCLGISSIVAKGASGTGYIPRNGGYGNFNERLARDLYPYNPDILFIMLGANDASTNSPMIPCLTGLRAIRSRYPGMPIFVVSNWGENTGPSASAIAVEGQIAAAVAAFADPDCFYIRTNVPANGADPYTYGTGNDVSPNGTGNSDIFISGTSTGHPSDKGHYYMGIRLADEVAALVRAKAAQADAPDQFTITGS